MEAHGREGIVEGVDVRRTLGWFTSLYPVLLPVSSGTGLEGLEEQVRRVKKVMGGVPRKGIGYGLLRYLSKHDELRERLKRLPQPEIIFNYLGQWDGGEGREGGAGWLELAEEGVGECQSRKQERGHLFEVTAAVMKGRLKVGWNYGRKLHRRETVEGLIDRFMETLHSIAKLCRPNTEESHQARFPMARLKAEQLRAIVEKVERAHQAK
jgi:non-ribosomal peptide synthase protein (TIGR01720 family)